MSEGTGAGAAIGVGFMAVLSVFARNADGCGRAAARGMRSADDVVLASARHVDDFGGSYSARALAEELGPDIRARALASLEDAPPLHHAGELADGARRADAPNPWAPLNGEGARRGARARVPGGSGARNAAHAASSSSGEATDIVVEVVQAGVDAFVNAEGDAPPADTYAPVLAAGGASLDERLMASDDEALVLMYGPSMGEDDAIDALKRCAAYRRECIVASAETLASFQSRVTARGASAERLAAVAAETDTTLYRVVSTSPVRVAAFGSPN